MTATLRLADLLGGLSIACDLGFGLPPEEAMRSCLISTALARRLGMPEEEVADAYYTSLLMHVGCSALSHETASIFGDERPVLTAVASTNVADPVDIAENLMPIAMQVESPAVRAQIEHFAATDQGEFGRNFDTGSCEIASATARRVGLGKGAERSLKEAVEWWNGQGPPKGLEGDEIALAARVARAAADAARFEHIGGEDAAVKALRARSGAVLDPAIVETFVANAGDILTETQVGDPRERILEVEPEPVAETDVTDLVRLARAFGDLADMKMPWTHGHSGGVARLAGAAARTLKLDAQTSSRLEISALLADLGKVAVSNAIWEKPGSLTRAEWEQARTHSYYSERILAQSEALAPMARVAGMHHERLDGSGYYRGCVAKDVPPATRVLAAADAFHAMTQPRPHRPARSDDEAAVELQREVRAGRMDRDAATAVIDAAGGARPKKRANLRPGGLSEREVEVARLVAAGYSNPQIAEQLVISRRTAEHHVQNIYSKVGVASRVGLAFFAHEHDLIER